jgi:UDP-N-acetylglucosamine acyltransferase
MEDGISPKPSAWKSRRYIKERNLEIHPTALVHPAAVFGPGVRIGAFSIIGKHVRIGEGTQVESHVVVEGWTEIGERCHIFPYAYIGAIPQAFRYRGEPTQVIIGHDNVIREYVTIHRGTADGKGKTVLGNHNFIMGYSHIAHDCEVGNQVVMANASTLGGHILVEDHAIIGGLVAIHQFVRVGRYAIIGGASGVPMDIPPYMRAAGNRAKLFGLNTVGLKRHAFPEETVQALKQAYKILFRSHLTIARAIARVEAEVPALPEIQHLLAFIRNSERGVCR